MQVLNLGLEHIDEQSEAMGQRMDRVRAPDFLAIVVNQGETGWRVQNFDPEVFQKGKVLEIDAEVPKGGQHVLLKAVLCAVGGVLLQAAAALVHPPGHGCHQDDPSLVQQSQQWLDNLE